MLKSSRMSTSVASAIVRVSTFPARHGFTTTALGSIGLNGATDAGVIMRRRQRLAEQIGFDLGRAALAAQVHGIQVRAFRREEPQQGGQSVLGTDVLATEIPGQALLTFHADCFPLLFFDKDRGVVAAAHAGWRGLLQGVAAETIRALNTTYGSRPADMQVLIGPGICKACYEVGPDVAGPVFKRYGKADRYLSLRGQRYLLDLAAMARIQLEEMDVPPPQIHQSGWCSREDERWFSHRAGRRGRFLSAIVLD